MKKFLIQLAAISRFVGDTIRYVFKGPFEFRELTRQCYLIGYRSFFLIGFTSFIAGIVFTRQSRPSLASFGAESWLPSLVSQAVVRSLGPLITALICAGKLGSNIGAELGSMRVSEQIDAMEVSGTRPFSYLVVTRVIAATMMLPILVMYADTIALLGSYMMVNMINKSSFQLFVNEVAVSVTYLDIFSSLVKSAIFGFAIGIVGCYAGYNTSGGTTGVGRAANTAVVVSMVFIFVIDLVSLQFINLFRTT
ncbi:MlaE family ABC transporter permease [Pseudochryseolinea flava]|uniref:ABC transporter permease n=1 Tax=Pseudochryseolinea flava TaxID=2059302 RepID=A0A364Y493_9BACT|nr:ABC transporter permease [Pseudochryseolinea flava]RAW01770.1 ABC transporter permease [Pseudochryseolinea flava]